MKLNSWEPQAAEFTPPLAAGPHQKIVKFPSYVPGAKSEVGKLVITITKIISELLYLMPLGSLMGFMRMVVLRAQRERILAWL